VRVDDIPPSLRPAVELRHRKTRRRLPEDLVRLPQLAVLTLNRPLKKSAARDGFLLWQPAAFGFGAIVADDVRA
jgi:hypothetical protein